MAQPKVDLDRYMDLFVHRTDVFAMQQESGAYYPQQREISYDDVLEHLSGWASYGAYVIQPHHISMVGAGLAQNTVKYVVFDLDIYDVDSFRHLQWCVEGALGELPEWDALNPRCLLAEDSGGKGYHVWLFFSDPLPAIQVRRWLGWAFWPLWLEGAAEEGWPLEVFPKQDSVEEGGYGNLVKLPLGKHAKSGNWSEFIPLPGWASGVSDVVPLESGLVPPLTDGMQGDTKGEARTSQTPFPCIDRILSGDVPSGVRNEALFHLALWFYGNGIDEDLAKAQVLRVNAELASSLPESEVVRSCVRSAYSGRYRAGCGLDWLREFCPGPCTKWTVGVSPSADVLKRLKEGDKLTVEVAAVTRQGKTTRVTLTHPDAQNRPTLVVE